MKTNFAKRIEHAFFAAGLAIVTEVNVGLIAATFMNGGRLIPNSFISEQKLA